jgi:hypothetical protein
VSTPDEFHAWMDREFERAMDQPIPHTHDAQDVAQHIIQSECLAHTHRLLALLKLVRMGVVTLDQVIGLAEARVMEAESDEAEEV